MAKPQPSLRKFKIVTYVFLGIMLPISLFQAADSVLGRQVVEAQITDIHSPREGRSSRSWLWGRRHRSSEPSEP